MRAVGAAVVTTTPLDEAIAIIEAADNRALATDGPVGHARDEMTDAEWRALYVALTAARKALDAEHATTARLREALRYQVGTELASRALDRPPSPGVVRTGWETGYRAALLFVLAALAPTPAPPALDMERHEGMTLVTHANGARCWHRVAATPEPPASETAPGVLSRALDHDSDCPARDLCECGAEGYRQWAATTRPATPAPPALDVEALARAFAIEAGHLLQADGSAYPNDVDLMRRVASAARLAEADR